MLLARGELLPGRGDCGEAGDADGGPAFGAEKMGIKFVRV